MKKNLFSTALIIVILSVGFTACDREETTNVRGVSLLTPIFLLPIDSILDITATITPHTATNRAVIWTSSNNTVATIAETSNPQVGRVTAREFGETTITATTRDGNFTATSTVTVTMPAVGRGCNGDLPGWGTSLGTVSFATSQEWIIGSQIWSDAVTATNCDKVSFYGGSNNNFNADCRSNPGFPGDLFSWCAVMRFATILCPYPWRVPTRQDFTDLDISLGGSGYHRRGDSAIITKYINDWGAIFGGFCHGDGTLTNYFGHYNAFYWSQISTTMSNAAFLHLTTDGQFSTGFIFLAGPTKRHGKTLRCIRDNN